MFLKTTLTALLSLFCINSSFAQDATSTFPAPAKPATTDEWRTHVGVMAGYSNTEGAYDKTLGYGVDWGVQPYIPFALGAELASTTNEGDMVRTTLLGRGTYNFGGTIPVINRSYIGAMLGPVWDTESRNNGVRFGIAPVVGFDMPIGKQLTEKTITLGLNARYLFVNESVEDTFALNGAVKYWF